MFFYETRDDIITVDFFFDSKARENSMISAYTSFGENNKSINLSVDFINKNLDIIQYKVTQTTVRAAFFKKKYFELYKNKEKKKNDYIELDIPFIINISIVYDNCNEFTTIRYKIKGFDDEDLKIEYISNDKYFTEIQRFEGYEIIERSRLDEKLKFLKQNEEWIKKLKNGHV